MPLLDAWIAKVKPAGRTLLLAEGQDPRVMRAAAKIATLGIAGKVIVLATPQERTTAGQGISFAGLNVEFLDYTRATVTERLAAAFCERRKSKGVTIEQARQQMADRIYFGDMLLREGLADCLVAGSIATTPDMVRAAFQCIGTAPGIKTGSSFFAMELLQPTPGGEGVLIYADAGVNPDPTPEQFVDIVVSTIRSYPALVGGQARVAMLSFSTKGSAKHAMVDKMAEATRLAAARVQALKLDALVDGELQVDSAIVPAIAASKCPSSPLKGRANILVFPDLQSGNISYKLTERLAGARAYGPIMQGLAKPANDLSRGCSTDDIVAVAAIAACQSMP